MSNSTSGLLTTSIVEYAVLIVLPPSIYIGPKSKYNSGLIARLHGTFAHVEERDVKK